jgi:hypothetical protein
VVAGLLAGSPRLGRVRMLAVDGPSGAGKTTVTACIARLLAAGGARVAVVPTDHFATWADPVSWWPRLVAGVLTPLCDGRPGEYRLLDWPGGTPRLGGLVTVPVPDVLIVEGVSAGRAAVREYLTLLAWVELADADLRLARTIARDGEGSRADLSAWQRFERGWFAADGTRAAADVRLPG